MDSKVCVREYDVERELGDGCTAVTGREVKYDVEQELGDGCTAVTGREVKSADLIH